MSVYCACLINLMNLIISCAVLWNFFLNEIKYHKDVCIDSVQDQFPMQNSRVKPKKAGCSQAGKGKNAQLSKRLEKLGSKGKSELKAA